MTEIILQKIVCKKNRVSFEYNIPEAYSNFIRQDQMFYYEYLTNIDFTNVPKSILIIPFVMNFMPLIWVSGGVLTVEELDKSFYESLDMVLNGIKRVYPDVAFNGKLVVQHIIENKYVPNKDEKTVLFSGGVDAVSTLVSHIDEKPTLINVWGADIDPNDMENHLVIQKDLQSFAKSLNLNFFFIRSSLRWCFDEAYLTEYWRPVIKDTWWHGLQHSIGLLALLAPYDYLNKVEINYIASSFTKKDIGKVRCINYPFIDSALQFASTVCYHDGFEYNRLQKVKNILDYKKHSDLGCKLPLKVCYYPKQGNNCCRCEKCLRTICAILALGDNPEDYGFQLDYKNPEAFIKNYCDKTIIGETAVPLWFDMADYVRSQGTPNRKMEWLINYQFNSYVPKWYMKILRRPIALLRRFKQSIMKMIG